MNKLIMSTLMVGLISSALSANEIEKEDSIVKKEEIMNYKKGEILFNDSDIEIKLLNTIKTKFGAEAEVGLNFLYIGDNNSDMDGSSYRVSVPFTTKGKIIGNLYGKIGFSGNIIESTDYWNMAVEGEIDYKIDTKIPISLVGKVSYSPEFMSFGDSTGYLERSAEVQAEIMNGIALVVGYRNIKIDTKNESNINVNKSGYIGVSFKY